MTRYLSKKLKHIGKKLEGFNPGSMIIIGLGNPDRADDGAGIQLAGLLEKRFPDQVFSERERSVEGLVLEHIEAQKTETILFVDAASFSPIPGEVTLFGAEDIGGLMMDMSTHKVPVSLLMEMIREHGKIPLLLGIQPESLAFLQPMSEPIKDTVNDLALLLSSYMETGRGQETGIPLEEPH